MKKEKKNKLPFKQRLFNKYLEKPISDILAITYELYKSSCRVYELPEDIINFEDYCKLVNEDLKKSYEEV